MSEFRNTGTLMRDGFMVAQFEDDAETYPRHVGQLYIDGNFHTVEQTRELRDFLNQVLPEADDQSVTIAKLRDDLTAASLERDALKTALHFYADAQNYVRKDHYSTPSQDFPAWTEPSNVMNDCGDKAREALK